MLPRPKPKTRLTKKVIDLNKFPGVIQADYVVAAKKMEAMHTAEAEAKEKAHQEGWFQHLSSFSSRANTNTAAAKMEAMHVAEAEAKDKASQEGKTNMLVRLTSPSLTIY